MNTNTPTSSRWLMGLEQLQFLGHELCLLSSGKATRWLVIFFEPAAGVTISYRIDRCGYLLCGQVWMALRVLAYPLFLVLRLLSCRHEICCKAQIGRGLQLTHPTLGMVINGDAIIGRNCLLNGGNSIGVRRGIVPGQLVVGDDVTLGVNSCVLGPLRIGNRVVIGAGAIVVSDLPDDCVARGVPARGYPV
ncbi:MAG: serine acetyltransferase [Verrucomicrobia bacterium]|nr:MAG: serine acetyltransferase [Verrucomicrobiota bacterium]